MNCSQKNKKLDTAHGMKEDPETSSETFSHRLCLRFLADGGFSAVYFPGLAGKVFLKIHRGFPLYTFLIFMLTAAAVYDYNTLQNFKASKRLSVKVKITLKQMQTTPVRFHLSAASAKQKNCRITAGRQHYYTLLVWRKLLCF